MFGLKGIFILMIMGYTNFVFGVVVICKKIVQRMGWYHAPNEHQDQEVG